MLPGVWRSVRDAQQQHKGCNKGALVSKPSGMFGRSSWGKPPDSCTARFRGERRRVIRTAQKLQIEINGAKLVASGWFAILVGAVVLLAAVMLPVIARLLS